MNKIQESKPQTVNPQRHIKVTIHIPENVSAAVRQRKINAIYDILTAKK